ncbi:hypothetical protein ARMGADRAFT_1022458 [Armillaria gallica]|uniref:Uncharacterized protein n=1 Tax=Armillaria gallica TaxID=47427 RepID=A0A2H3E8Z0_ARMGA|nr:hypothetical protein ARMGADRAFT_1022458 [Armillaria gallica]
MLAAYNSHTHSLSSLPSLLFLLLAIRRLLSKATLSEEIELDTLSVTVLDTQMALTTTVLIQGPEASNPQQVTFAHLGSWVTLVGYINREGTLLRAEVILSRGNFNVSVGYNFGEHVSLVLELTVLKNGDVRIIGGDIGLSFGSVFQAQYHFIH